MDSTNEESESVKIERLDIKYIYIYFLNSLSICTNFLLKNLTNKITGDNNDMMNMRYGQVKSKRNNYKTCERLE